MARTFEWAKPCSVSKAKINKALKMVEEEEASIICKIQNAIETDTDDESERLLMAYMNATPKEKAAIDGTLVHICGYSLGTLIKQMLGEEEGI